MGAVRLENPSAAAAFAARAAADLPAGALRSGAVSFETWEDQRANALRDADPIQLILTTFALLLLIVAFVIVAILVGARASQQRRVIGVRKAAGLTPRQVGAVSRSNRACSGFSPRRSAPLSGRRLRLALPRPAPRRCSGRPRSRPTPGTS